MAKQRNTQAQLVAYLTKNPCQKEYELVWKLWGEIRSKKHSDLIHRALRARAIKRVRVKMKGIDRVKVWRYFVPGTIKLITQI
jgi:hypothetical protein